MCVFSLFWQLISHWGHYINVQVSSKTQFRRMCVFRFGCLWLMQNVWRLTSASWLQNTLKMKRWHERKGRRHWHRKCGNMSARRVLVWHVSAYFHPATKTHTHTHPQDIKGKAITLLQSVHLTCSLSTPPSDRVVKWLCMQRSSDFLCTTSCWHRRLALWK